MSLKEKINLALRVFKEGSSSVDQTVEAIDHFYKNSRYFHIDSFFWGAYAGAIFVSLFEYIKTLIN